jgi:predicted transcriptional regulator
MPMTDKQAVLDALSRLPEAASLDEITEELRIMAAIRRGRADIAAGRSMSHEEVEQAFESWASAWPSCRLARATGSLSH